MQTNDRVRAHSPEFSNRQIDEESEARVRACSLSTEGQLTERIDALDREWDIERVLEMNASALAFAGLALGVARSGKWFVLPALVLPFLFLHAVQGWCPPLPMLRRLGFRTRGEIDEEKYALKVLRGDFKESEGADTAGSAIAAVRH